MFTTRPRHNCGLGIKDTLHRKVWSAIPMHRSVECGCRYRSPYCPDTSSQETQCSALRVDRPLQRPIRSIPPVMCVWTLVQALTNRKRACSRTVAAVKFGCMCSGPLGAPIIGSPGYCGASDRFTGPRQPHQSEFYIHKRPFGSFRYVCHLDEFGRLIPNVLAHHKPRYGQSLSKQSRVCIYITCTIWYIAYIIAYI